MIFGVDYHIGCVVRDYAASALPLYFCVILVTDPNGFPAVRGKCCYYILRASLERSSDCKRGVRYTSAFKLMEGSSREFWKITTGHRESATSPEDSIALRPS
jgi:hypothetical protein